MNSLWRCLVTAMLVAHCGPALALAETERVGFLVIAPDRGFLGNREIEEVFGAFSQRYGPASLAWVGRGDDGLEHEYSVYLGRAVAELKRAGASRIIAIPFFLSEGDPALIKARSLLHDHAPAGMTHWAAPMTESHLVGQILLDRVDALSREPRQERLVVIGAGATTEANSAAIKADLDRYLAYVTARRPFLAAKTVVYYDRAAEGAAERNKAVDATIRDAAAARNRTIAVLFALGPKYDPSMSLGRWIARRFKDLDLALGAEGVLPHPNALLWLSKTANGYLPASEEDIGVVIMPHGATRPWNDAVEQVITPLRARRRIELVYGMGDPALIQDAVSRLERQGVRRIVFVRMYPLAHHMKQRIDYILGLTPTFEGQDHDEEPPAQIRSSALFATVGGYEEYPDIAEVLHERIVEISRTPSEETVLLLAHGDESEEGNEAWLAVMNAHIARLRRDPHCAGLRALRAATVREDWPDLRERAVAEVRELIRRDARQGRVLVIADRLYGAGPYRRLLRGLEYVLNERGLAHPVLTRWLDEEIERAAALLALPREQPDARPTGRGETPSSPALGREE